MGQGIKNLAPFHLDIKNRVCEGIHMMLPLLKLEISHDIQNLWCY